MPDSPIAAAAARQAALNEATAAHWDLYATHRARLMGLIRGAAENGPGRLCIAGAGNCNDLDLAGLARGFREIHLVDLDETAIRRAVAAQRPPPGAVHLHAGVDLMGLWPETSPFGPADDARLGRLIQAAEEGTDPGVGHDFDVVVSAGVLSQLLESVAHRLGEDHARMADLVAAIRNGHIRTLLRTLRPGGRLILATEVMSTQEAPAIAAAPEEAWPALLSDAIWRGEVLTGMSPPALVSWLVATRPEGARLVAPGIVGPWRWQQSPGRHFLVVAYLLRKGG